MKPILAIAKTTIRSSLRSHVFQVTLFFLLITVFVLPLIIKGDNTAQGQLQLSLTYALGIVGILLSMVTLWLSCTVVAEDIDGYQIHMVVSKPVPCYAYWLGKCLGIVAIQTFLLAIAAVCLYGLILWRLNTSQYPEVEMTRLKNEVLVGRRVYRPELPDIEQLVDRELARRLQTGELPEHMTQDMARNTIRRQLKARMNELAAGQLRTWEFRGLPTTMNKEDPMFLRYRMYLDKPSSRDQRDTDGYWLAQHPVTEQWVMLRQRVRAGRHHEVLLTPEVVSESGRARIAYDNQDPGGKSVVFQALDGPNLLIGRTSFASNYGRVIFLMFLQIVFLAVLGCAAGANLSVPVAIFLSLSYVLMGMIILAMTPATPEDDYKPKDPLGITAYHVRQGLSHITVSINEFNQIGRLAKGELIELYAPKGFGGDEASAHVGSFLDRLHDGLFGRQSLLGILLYPFLFHSIVIAAFAIYCLKQRELGLVIRK